MSILSGIDLSQLGTQFSKLGNNAFKGGFKNPNLTAAVGTAIDAVGSFMPTKSVYSGEKGNVAATADSIYDTASDIIGMVPGWGNIASLAMKGKALLSKGISALGGGTDGMCVCAGTLIYTKTGKLVPIEELKHSDGILGWDPLTKQIVPQEITNVITPTEKECIKIVLEDGSYLQCSIDHPILSNLKEKAESHNINGKRIAYRNWEFNRADALKVGNWVGKANNIDFWGDIELPQAYLVGMLIGDGTYGKGSSCRIFSADPDTWKYIEENNLGVINHCDDNRPEKYSREVKTYRIINGMELMRSLGLVYQTHENKTLPKDIFKYTKDSICKLIAGLYDTDGSISVNTDKSQYSITLYQSNKSLLQEVQTQLYKLGIKSTISTRKAAQYKIGGRICNSKINYRLEVHDYRSAQNFYKLIPLNISYKKEALEKIYKLSLTKKIKEHSDISGASQVKIIDIIPLGKQTVYNLTCTPNHTYIANNIITHNTTADALLGSNFFQMTPMGLINGFGGRKSHTLENGQSERDTITNVGSAYGGSVGDWQNAMKYSNKKYGAFSFSGRHKANNKVDDANYKMNLMTGISNQARTQLEVANGTADTTDKRYELTLQGGYNPRTRIGRQGLKIEYIKRAKMIANKVKDQNVTKHKEGGKVEEEKFFIPTDWQPLGQLQKFQNGGAVNIIPEGSLHARKHHMENADNLTKKGIPVVDNDGNQQAEIERDEIIFRKEVTDQIEKLAKEGTDEAAIKCGELLTHEIIENTDDKTGLALQIINKFQNGGNIGNPNGKDILDGGSLPEVTVTGKMPKMPSVADAFFNVNNITSPNIHIDIPNKKSPTLDSGGFSWTQAAGKAISGISNAINTSKQQKAEYNQKIQQQKDEMVAGTGTQDGNAQLFQQLQKVPTDQQGGDIEKRYQSFITALPINLKPKEGDNYNMRRYWELKGMPNTFNSKDSSMWSWHPEDRSYHAFSVAYNKDNDTYEFVKSSKHPTIQKELDRYNSPEGKEFKDQYELITTDDKGTPLEYYKYIRRKNNNKK